MACYWILEGRVAILLVLSCCAFQWRGSLKEMTAISLSWKRCPWTERNMSLVKEDQIQKRGSIQKKLGETALSHLQHRIGSCWEIAKSTQWGDPASTGVQCMIFSHILATNFELFFFFFLNEIFPKFYSFMKEEKAIGGCCDLTPVRAQLRSERNSTAFISGS